MSSEKLVNDYLKVQLELLCDCTEILDHVQESLPKGSVMAVSSSTSPSPSGRCGKP